MHLASLNGMYVCQGGKVEREEKKDDKDQKNGNSSRSTPSPSDETDTAVETASSIGEANDHRFELRDITVMFPEGELTVVTGPTASGKTALLVCLLNVTFLGKTCTYTFVRWPFWAS